MGVRIFNKAFEHWLFRRKSKAAIGHIPPPLPRDDNNFLGLTEAVSYPGIEAVSFDFFDTLFFRQHLSLDQVFLKTAQLGAGLIPGDHGAVLSALVSARGFTSAQAKRRMITAHEGDEPSLEEIFDEALRGFLPDPLARRQMAQQLTKIEAAIELQNLVPNPAAASVLRNLKLMGRRIVVTSDMYLPGSALVEILQANDLEQYFDDVIVSCDYGVTKASGDLFDLVKLRLDLPGHKILHIGDKWESDVVSARAHDLQAMHYYNHSREAEAQSLHGRQAVMAPQMIRRGELQRKFGLAKDGPLNSLEAIIDQVIGPACAIFMHQVLQQAARRGSSDIFFLTRDGTIFKQIADAMIAAAPSLYPDAAPRKILASSRATGVILSSTQRNPDYFYANTEYLTEQPFSYDNFCKVFQLPLDQIATLPDHCQARIERVKHDPSLEAFRDLYWHGWGFSDRLHWRLDELRETMLRYLDEQGLFTARNPVIVDIGYSATWGKQITPALEERQNQHLPIANMLFSFFATNRFFPGNIKEFHPSISVDPGHILDHRDLGCLSIGLNYSWLEPFFLDPSLGKLEAFSSGKTVNAQFAPSRYSTAKQAELNYLRTAITQRAARFAEDLLRHPGDVPELRRLVQARLIRLIGRPRRCEVAAINQLSHERGMASTDRQRIALLISPRNLPAKLRYLMDNDYWVQGTLTRSYMGVINRLTDWRYARDRAEVTDWTP